MRSLILWTILTLSPMLACGGREQAGAADAGDMAEAPPAADLDAAVTQGCATSSGYAICGGPKDCFAGATGMGTSCWECDVLRQVDGGFPWGLCLNQKLPNGPPHTVCEGDCVYIEAFGVGLWNSLPFEVGDLFYKNGGGDRVRYADFSMFTDAPLASGGVCPSLEGGAHACGPGCPGCGSGEICTGRSPIHPFGLCVGTSTSAECSIAADAGTGYCPAGPGACFIFTVQPETQPLADHNGFCLPVAGCQSAATGLTGGGTCH